MTKVLAAVLCCFSILAGCAAQKQVSVQDSGSTDQTAVHAMPERYPVPTARDSALS